MDQFLWTQAVGDEGKVEGFGLGVLSGFQTRKT